MNLLKTEEKPAKATDKKTLKKVFINLIIAIVVMAYFCTLSVVYKQWLHNNIVDVVKISTMVFLVIALVLIEIAYKKESKRVVIHSFEALALAIHSLTTMYITKVNNFDFNNYILLSSYAFSIYYVLKTIFITTKARKDFVNGLSDISEIVKKEEPKKKEASKKDKKKNKKNNEQIQEKESDSVVIVNDDNDEKLESLENEDIDEDIDIEEDINEEIEEKIEDEEVEGLEEDNVEEYDEDLEDEENEKENLEDSKSITNDKLAQLRAKIRRLQDEEKPSIKEKQKEKKESEIEEKQEDKKAKKLTSKNTNKKENKEDTKTQQAKKRGRPRKSESTNKDSKTKESKVETNTDKAKKRGRPKKEV